MGTNWRAGFRILPEIVAYIFSFAILIFIVYSIWLVFTLPYIGVDISRHTGLIFHIDQTSPVMGLLRVGDQIISTDIDSGGDGITDFYRREIGEQIEVTIHEYEEPRVVSIQLQPPPLEEVLERSIPLIVALIFWISGVILLSTGSKNMTTVLFFMIAQLGALGLTTGLNEILGQDWTDYIFPITILFIGPLIAHFHFNFPTALDFRHRKIFLVLIYTVAIFLAIVRLLPIFGYDTSSNIVRIIGRGGDVYFYLSIYLLGGSALLVMAYRRSRSVDTREKIRFVTLAGLIGFLPLLVFTILPTLAFGQPLIPYHLAFIFTIMIPWSYGYSIYRNSSSGSGARVSRAASEAIVYAFLFAILLLIIGLLRLHFSEISGADSLILAIIFFLFAVGLSPAKGYLSSQLQLILYGSTYDFRSLVTRSSQVLSQTTDSGHFNQKLLNTIRLMHFPAAAVLKMEQQTLVFDTGFGFENQEFPPLPTKSPLFAQVNGRKSPVLLEEIRKVVNETVESPEEQFWLSEVNADIWVPFLLRGDLRGALILKAPAGEAWVSQEDMDILATIASLAAVAAENADLLKAMRKQLSITENARLDLAESRSRLAEGREAERLRLARDLHDGPIQDLHALRLRIGGLQISENDHRQVRVKEELLQVIHELREVCVELRPPALEYFGIEAALRSLVDRFRQKHPMIVVDLEISRDGSPLPDQFKLALYRIFQEALNNVRQHAQAASIRVFFSEIAGLIVLEVRDDGIGFLVPEKYIDFARKGNLGLLGIAERAESIAGTLTVLSEPGKGTILRVVVPAPVIMDDSSTYSEN